MADKRWGEKMRESEMAKKLPPEGMPRTDIVATLSRLKDGDIRWAEGRTPMFVFKGDEEVSAASREAFNMFFGENALAARRAYPSVRRMEEDILSIGLDLLHGSDEARGYFTTGGTESIMAAVKAARDMQRSLRGDTKLRGNMVLPETAHPAFTKSCDLMDLEERRVPVGEDCRADAAAMEAATDNDTMMIVGSVPCFPYGVVDPIPELSELAMRRGLWLHVDACVGGYLAPFAAELGRDIPTWDFKLAGVSSISADLHKFGYAPKPASTVFFANAEKADKLLFSYDVWPNGIYLTATIVGTRPAGGVAGAWATLHGLGREGYLRVNQRLFALVDRYREGIESIPGLRVIADPQLSILSFTSDEVNLHQAGERMRERGWLPGFIKRPTGMHLMLSLIHEQSCEDWLSDLRWAVDAERNAQQSLKAKVTVEY
jgi:glutamate/tyrosine decarboxylase-like PLP-dependent enzyme